MMVKLFNVMVLVRIWVVWVPSPFYGAHSEV